MQKSSDYDQKKIMEQQVKRKNEIVSIAIILFVEEIEARLEKPYPQRKEHQNQKNIAEVITKRRTVVGLERFQGAGDECEDGKIGPKAEYEKCGHKQDVLRLLRNQVSVRQEYHQYDRARQEHQKVRVIFLGKKFFQSYSNQRKPDQINNEA